ncbi:hypothetical protein HRH50_04865 [Enterococcus faecalis]|nr:hypothetical protein [Enterococcus faecalis]
MKKLFSVKKKLEIFFVCEKSLFFSIFCFFYFFLNNKTMRSLPWSLEESCEKSEAFFCHLQEEN